MTRDQDTLDAEGMALAGRLVGLGLEGATQEDLLEAYCAEVLRAGVPILRVHLAQRAYHPQFGSFGFDWLREGGLDKETYARRDEPLERWLRSPLYALLEQDSTEMMVDLRGAEDRARFPIFADLHAQGATAYLAVKVPFAPYSGTYSTDPNNPVEGFMMSWTVDGPEGLSTAHATLLRGLTPYLGLALKSAANRQMASDIVSTYLGADAGERVLSGDIMRGSTQRMDAVIWYFDLEGFTRLTEQLAGEAVIALLNAYFGIVVEVVEGFGGNVLKFMGDGVLAVFDQQEHPQAVDQAVAAAMALEARLAALSIEREAEGAPVAGYTLALHRGRVLYGNIGGAARLDFTVIGAAVNTTARILGMCGQLQQRLILSADVAEGVSERKGDLVSLGRYMLRGVQRPMALFTVWDGDGRRTDARSCRKGIG